LKSQPEPEAQEPNLVEWVDPPLIAAAVAECLAGALIGGAALLSPAVLATVLASGLLFAAASVFGRHFDAAHEARAQPTARVALSPSGDTAWQLAWVLLVLGLLLPAVAGPSVLLAAVGVALVLVLHAAALQREWGLGFLTWGAARGLNLALGLSLGEFGLSRYGLIALPVALYAVGWAILRTSRQPGVPPTTGFVALLHLSGSLAAHLYQAVRTYHRWTEALVFLALFVWLAFPRFVRAVMEPRRPLVAEAVQYGFVGLTLMEAAMAAGYAGASAGALVGLLALGVFQALKRWPVSLVTTPR